MPASRALIPIDVNAHRRDIVLHGLTGADEVYTLYYDETNNHRLLRIGPTGLNVRKPQCFVLGGIGHHGPPRGFPFAELKKHLWLQPSLKELKLTHLGKGGFLDLLSSEKLLGFLQWIEAQGLFIHFHALDPLYFGFVDIVDSILAEQGDSQLYAFAIPLKDTLFTLVRSDPEPVIALCGAYRYPDVDPERNADFLQDLMELLGRYRANVEPFAFQMLKGIFAMGRRLKGLPFLAGETPHVLMDEYRSVYLLRLCLFKNAHHILDDEGQIRPEVETWRFMDGDRPLSHYRFAQSHEEAGIQLSDPIAGLLGKFFSFLAAHDNDELEAAKAGFSARQLACLRALSSLLDHSIAQSEAFAGYLMPLTDRRRASLFLDIP